MLLEIACFDMTSAETALKSVADRIEFCSGKEEGGLTPNFDEFRYLKTLYTMPIYVMIRPKGGAFIYSPLEFEQMCGDVESFRLAGADGFVFGVLESGRTIDRERNRELLQLAGGLPCTFHRAVDRTPDVLKSVGELADLEFASVLTSGGKSSAMAGLQNLQKLTEMYSGTINILVGGGVRASNIQEIQSATGATHFHSSAIRDYEFYASDEEIKLLKKAL